MIWKLIATMLIFVVPLLWHFLRPFCQKNHMPRIRHLPFTADWIWPLCRNIFNGCSCHYGEKEKGFRQNIIHFLDHPTILNLWILSFSEMFTAVGLIEFFYKQSLKGMQAFLTAMTYCSYSFGFFFWAPCWFQWWTRSPQAPQMAVGSMKMIWTKTG
jgi:hypothetical protein